MKILDVVMGSNHFLIQPQTVGKKDGAPIIYTVNTILDSEHDMTYKYPIQGLWIMSCSQLTRILHMTFQIPELLETYMRNVDYIIGLINRGFRIGSSWYSRAQGHDETNKILIQGKKSKHPRR